MTKKDAIKYTEDFPYLTAWDILNILYDSYYPISGCYVGKSVTRKKQSRVCALNRYKKLIEDLINEKGKYYIMCNNKAHITLAIRCIMDAF
jgi:hypothetical protein